MPNPSAANFQPRRRLISDVTVAPECTVTTTEDHGYELDQLVRLHIDKVYGMEINGEIGKVISIPSSVEVELNLDTSRQDPYVEPVGVTSYTQAHVVPITGIERNDTSITG